MNSDQKDIEFLYDFIRNLSEEDWNNKAEYERVTLIYYECQEKMTLIGNRYILQKLICSANSGNSYALYYTYQKMIEILQATIKTIKLKVFI